MVDLQQKFKSKRLHIIQKKAQDLLEVVMFTSIILMEP